MYITTTQDQYDGKGIIFVGLDIVTPLKNNYIESNDSDSLFWVVVMANSTFERFLDSEAFEVEAYQVERSWNIPLDVWLSWWPSVFCVMIGGLLNGLMIFHVVVKG